MQRIRLLDPEPPGVSTPADWRFAALTIATLFLNFPFWAVHGADVWMFWPLPLYAILLVACALLIVAVFFLGPSFAAQARGPLQRVVANSLGSTPAFGFRVCCILFLTQWIANVVSTPGLTWLSFILRRPVSSTETALIAAGVLVFLFITGLQSLRTNAKLALFTNKLGIAILVAALVRVRHGLPSALQGFPASSDSAVSNLWQGLSLLSFYVAPLALLASDLGCRSRGPKQLIRVALIGMALPLAFVLILVGVINVATLHSGFYQPSLPPNIAMALWNHAARSSLPGLMMVAGITMFGAVRFGVRALGESASIRSIGSWPNWIVLGCIVGAIASVSVHQNDENLAAVFEFSSTCLAITGSVLTADVLTGRTQIQRLRRIDGIGVLALAAGLATPLCIPLLTTGAAVESWWHPWLLPSCATGFLVCLAGGVVQKVRVYKAV